MSVGWLVLVFRRAINADLLAQTVKKLVDSGNADRAVKLCAAADCPATLLVYYLLGLEEPAEVIVREEEQQAAGYRDAAVAVREVPFGDRVSALAAREIGLLGHQQRRPGLAAVIGGLVALALGGLATLVRLRAGQQLGPVDAIALVGLVGAALGARAWYRINAGLRLVARTVVPLLCPVEEMNGHARSVAAKAREAHARRRR
jgi:hypothetical protein